MSCSSDDQSDKECPLCMEPLEIDDVDFYPCKCEYQICRFCWHRLRTNENGLCPACRQPYPEDPVNFKPLSSADLQRIKDEKKMKQQAEKQRISESRKHLANYRVLQKNLVYVVGLSSKVATEETLKKVEYFGRYGRIIKVVTGTSALIGNHIQPSHTAYVTYSRIEEALRAIQAVNNAQLDGRTVKASLGTTKYCSSFLRSQTCGKTDCMYLHDIAEDDISFTKEDMHLGKHTEYEKKLIDLVLNKRNQPQDRKPPPSWANNNKSNICWDQNGKEYQEQQPNGFQISADDPTPSEAAGRTERQNSQNKENQYDSAEPSNGVTRLKQSSDSPKQTAQTPLPETIIETTKRSISGPPVSSSFTSSTLASTSISPSSSVLQSTSSIPNPSTVPSSMIPDSNDFLSKSPVEFLLSNKSGVNRMIDLAEHFSPVRGVVPAPAPREEAPAPLTNWQSLLGLAPTPEIPRESTGMRLTPPPGLNSMFSDDDLGFDPFNESTKGLAKLLEEERIKRPHPSQHFQASQPSLMSSNLWGNSRSSTNHSRQGFPLDLFGSTPFQVNGGYNGFHQPSSMHQYHEHHQHSNHHHQSAHTPSHQPNSYAPPPGLLPSRAQSLYSQPQNMTEWQEGLKALLPNVNVRFASDLEQQTQSQSSQSQSQLHRWQAQFSSHSQVLPHSVPPPPGFSVPNR
ncbi:unnamed protein product [Auanema sp. JU1783]|nr:unnamed protein product [Auanema sp. JU1783]